MSETGTIPGTLPGVFLGGGGGTELDELDGDEMELAVNSISSSPLSKIFDVSVSGLWSRLEVSQMRFRTP